MTLSLSLALAYPYEQLSPWLPCGWATFTLSLSLSLCCLFTFTGLNLGHGHTLPWRLSESIPLPWLHSVLSRILAGLSFVFLQRATFSSCHFHLLNYILLSLWLYILCGPCQIPSFLHVCVLTCFNKISVVLSFFRPVISSPGYTQSWPLPTPWCRLS